MTSTKAEVKPGVQPNAYDVQCTEHGFDKRGLALAFAYKERDEHNKELHPKEFCTGSGKTADTLEHRRTSGGTFVQCPDCGRVLKPTPASGLLRQHQPRNKATASLDATRDTLWVYAVSTERKGHFALGLRVMVRFGAKPTGWQEDEPFLGNATDGWDEDDYDRWWTIDEVGGDGSFQAAGWYWEPEDLVVPR